MRNHLFIVLLIASLGVIGAAAGMAGPPDAPVNVRIRDLQFQPPVVHIKTGQSVTWDNADDRDHTVAATDNSFQSGNLKPGGSYTYRFTKPGNYAYGCTYHPRMRGSVQVSD